jgi:hypothetical protein
MQADLFHRTFTVDLKVLDLVAWVEQVVRVNTAHQELHKSVNHRIGC